MWAIRRALPSVTTCHGPEGNSRARSAPRTSRHHRHRLALARRRGRHPRQRHLDRRRSASSGSARRSSPTCCACRPRSPYRSAAPPVRSPTSASAAPRPITPCCSSRASAPTIPPRAISRASNCSTPTSPAGSRSCAGRNRRLWGSEAIGGVVAVDGAAPGSGGSVAAVEAGSFGTRRGSARTSFGSADRGVSLGIAAQRSDGIDSFAGDGERDGYRNLAARVAGRYRLSDALLLGASGFALKGAERVRRLRPRHLRARRHRRPHPQPARRRARLRHLRRHRRAAMPPPRPACSSRAIATSSPTTRSTAPAPAAARSALEAGHRIGRHALRRRARRRASSASTRATSPMAASPTRTAAAATSRSRSNIR